MKARRHAPAEVGFEGQLADARHKRVICITPNLWVTAEIGPKGIRKAQVVGVGAPRQNNIGLAAALKEEEERASAAKVAKADVSDPVTE